MKKKQGFTLIEVLITVTVLAVGLLGLAGLQVLSLRFNQTAYHRSQVTLLAYDMADRMRANRADANLGINSVYTTIAPGNAVVQVGCTAVAGNCNPAQMAQNDLFQWNTSLINILPGNNAIGIIAFINPLFSISIQWDDNRDGLINNTDPVFQTDFQL